MASNAYQKTVGYSDDYHNGFDIMLDTEEVATMW